MSLDGFHSALARLVGDPDLVRSVRRGDIDWIRRGELTEREAERVIAMANDPRMEVLCSLYRSNRLTALVRTVPSVIIALDDRLSDTLTEFWRERPRTDMQFRTEAADFCAFIRGRYSGDPEIQHLVDCAETALRVRYDDIAGGGALGNASPDDTA